VRPDGERRCLTCTRAESRAREDRRRLAALRRRLGRIEARANGSLRAYAGAVAPLVGRLSPSQLQKLDADLVHEERDVLRRLTQITIMRERIAARLEKVADDGDEAATRERRQRVAIAATGTRGRHGLANTGHAVSQAQRDALHRNVRISAA
jgi:hypothetical protein